MDNLKINLVSSLSASEVVKVYPHNAEVPPIHLLIKHSHSSGSKYFSRFDIDFRYKEFNTFPNRPSTFCKVGDFVHLGGRSTGIG